MKTSPDTLDGAGQAAPPDVPPHSMGNARGLDRRRRCGLAVGVAMVALRLAAADVRAPGGAATVEGRVLNASTGIYLNNARVVVEGTALETFTNENGEYRLGGVAAGEARVRASFAGLETQTAAVRAGAGETVRRDFELALPRDQTTAGRGETVQLERFVVESTALSAQAAAVNEQKYSPNIKNVVVLDEIGDLGDGNIGEYLKYTPGLSILFGPQTAASASIRGMPAGGVIFMIDGAEVSSPSVDRNFDLAASSSGSVDRVEITKVPTPDRPANAVGGTVNIVGKSGFSNPRRFLRLNTYAAYNSDHRLQPPGLGARVGSDRHSNERAIQPGIDVNYSHPVTKSFAFTINLSSMLRVYDMDYDTPTWDLIRGVQTTSTIQNVLQTTERQLASTTLDWRLNRENALRLNLDHVQINTPTRQSIFAAAWGAGNTGGPTFTQGAAAGNDTVRQTMTWGDRTRGTSAAVLRFVHEGRLYKFDASANYSRSWDERKDLEHGFFRTIGTASLGSLVVRGEVFDGIYDRYAPRVTATNRAGQAVDPYDHAQLTLGNPTSQPEMIKTDMKSLAANLSRPLPLDTLVVLKTGFSINRQRKDRTSVLKTWTFSPPATASRLAGAYDLTNESLSRQTFFRDSLQVRWLNPVKYYELYQVHPDWFVLNEAGAHQSGVTNSRFFQETISAAYLRGDVKLFDNRLWLVGGVRYEKTEDNGAGPRDDLRATYQQDASGNLLRDATGRPLPVTTDALATARLRYTERAAESSRTYAGYYPSFNSTFYLTEQLVARAAYAKTLGRPALSEVIPSIAVSDPAAAVRTATIVNSGLKPWSADNFDLSLEAYGLKGAVVAFSLFRKEIENFFLQVRAPATLEQLESFGLSDDYLDYDVITKTNGGNATVEGYEVSWRQSLHFLPAWAKGFQTFANATIAHLSGPNADDFSNFAHKNINWGLSYNRRSFSGRFNVAYAYKVPGAAAAASATVPAGTRSYIAPQITQDWSFEYRFAKRFTVYGSARNFNGANKRTERSGPGTPLWTRPQSYQNFGTLVTFGLRAQF